MGLALLVGIVMYILTRQGYPNVPFILGVILGPLFEKYLRTTLNIGGGNPLVFITQIDSLVFLLLTVVFVFFITRTDHSNKEVDS
jgi:putative tricarboxylic transport membrane protein